MSRLIHGRQRPLRGSYYDNLFLHYAPRGLWYAADPGPDAAVAPLSAEAVRWSQRRMGRTDWGRAWETFLTQHTNTLLRSQFGLGDTLTSVVEDEEEDSEHFKHILTPPG